MSEESNLTEKLQEKQSEIKFTEEELKQVQNIQSEYSSIQNTFGQLSISKERLKQQEELLLKQHNDLFSNFGKVQEDEQKFLDTITEKYGQGSLNPETGVFTPNKS